MAWLALVVGFEQATLHQDVSAFAVICILILAVGVGVMVGLTSYDLILWVRCHGNSWSGTLSCACKVCRKRQKPIVIADSPPPTFSRSSPFPPTAKRSARSRRLEDLSPATRAGSRRIKQHGRHTLAAYDPHRENHCGYQCLLVAAAKRPSGAAIKALRKRVADTIESDLMLGKNYGNLSIRTAVSLSGMTDEQYINDIRGQQWASPIELTAAAKILGIRTSLQVGGDFIPINEDKAAKRVNFFIAKRENHYLLMRTKTSRAQYGPMKYVRAGMRPQTGAQTQQNPMIVYINPTTLYAPPRVNIFTELTHEHDVRGATVVSSIPLTMTRIREILGALCSKHPHTFELLNPENMQLYADNEPVPHVILMRGGRHTSEPLDTIEIHIRGGETYSVPYRLSEDHLQFLQRISPFVNLPTSEFILVNHLRQPWIFPFDIHNAGPVYLEQIRGGMNRRASRSRSVSPTLTYHAGSRLARQLLPEPEYQEEPLPRRDDSRDPLDNSPRRGREPLPPGLQAQQPQPPMEDPQPDHQSRDQDMEIPAFEFPQYEEEERAIAIWLQPRDLPQPVRVIPLVQRDTIPMVYVLPRRLPPHIVQERIAASSEYDQIMIVTTIADQWTVTCLGLPDHIADIVERAGIVPRFPRAGGKRKSFPQNNDPKQVCATWAHQRAMECIPGLSPQTMSTLLRAEFRLSTAIMQSRSEDQVRHAVAAAFKRAGLTPPHGTPGAAQEPQQTPTVECAQDADQTRFWLAQMTSTLTAQTTLITELVTAQNAMATREEAQQAQNSYMHMIEEQQKEIRVLSNEVKALNSRIQEWETSYLPCIIDRLPHDHPSSPPSSVATTRARPSPYARPTTPKKPEDKDQQDEIDEKGSQEHDVEAKVIGDPTSQEQHEHSSDREQAEHAGAVDQGMTSSAREDPSPLAVLEAASLRAQCTKVIAAQASAPALLPFRASK